MRRGGKESGFTLIELLVVIAIISLLSTIVMASVTETRARARDAQRVSDMRQMMTALELYYQDHGKFPCMGDDTGGNPGNSVLMPLFEQGYIRREFIDPLNGYDAEEWSHYYSYSSAKKVAGGACGQIAILYFAAENSNTPCPNGQYRGDPADGGYSMACHIFYPNPMPVPPCYDLWSGNPNPYLTDPPMENLDADPPHLDPPDYRFPQACTDLIDWEYCDYDQTSC